MNELKFLELLAHCFEKLPGVGKKTANRYAYSVIETMTLEEVLEFANVLIETKQRMRHCTICNMLTIEDTCEICQGPLRDQTQIMVVRDTKDVLAIEKTGQFNGLYHILGGLISPLDGIGPDDLTIDLLEQRCEKDVKELILATSFTPAGETTALYIEKILSQSGIIISRIGYGIPAGGDIEYVDELTLKRAIDGRTKSK